MAITAIQKKQYLQARGVLCPFCGSKDIEGKCGVEVNEEIATQYIGCKKCGKHWTDVYKLVNVHEEG